MKNIIQNCQIEIHQIAKENDIAYLGLFGSYARNQDTSNSDIDLLVKFNSPGSLLRRARVKLKLEKLFNKKVDLVSQNALSPLLKPYIEKEIIAIYPDKYETT